MPAPALHVKASRRNAALTGLAGVAVISLLAACSGNNADQLNFVGFAVPAEANNEVFAAYTETAGESAEEKTDSYGASGDQSRAVANGQPADFVHFSIEPDVTRLADEGLVAEDWNDNDWNGYITDSVVVLVVREGNPEGIEDWEDLARDDIEIVTPNPGSSGAARWNILGAYLSQIQAGGSEEDAIAFTEDVVDNIVSFPASGRDATTSFLDGTGDVLISYENEAILGLQQGEEYDYIVPDRSLLIQNPGAVTENSGEQAQEFLDFAVSPEGQAIYAGFGFRPIPHVADEVEIGEVEGANDPADPFPEITHLATIDDDLGGWDTVVDEFFDEDGIITQITEQSGLN